MGLGLHFAAIPTVAEPRDKARHLERDRDRAASPPNLIREMSRFDDSQLPLNTLKYVSGLLTVGKLTSLLYR